MSVRDTYRVLRDSLICESDLVALRETVSNRVGHCCSANPSLLRAVPFRSGVNSVRAASLWRALGTYDYRPLRDLGSWSRVLRIDCGRFRRALVVIEYSSCLSSRGVRSITVHLSRRLPSVRVSDAARCCFFSGDA